MDYYVYYMDRYFLSFYAYANNNLLISKLDCINRAKYESNNISFLPSCFLEKR